MLAYTGHCGVLLSLWLMTFPFKMQPCLQSLMWPWSHTDTQTHTHLTMSTKKAYDKIISQKLTLFINLAPRHKEFSIKIGREGTGSLHKKRKETDCNSIETKEQKPHVSKINQEQFELAKNPLPHHTIQMNSSHLPGVSVNNISNYNLVFVKLHIRI